MRASLPMYDLAAVAEATDAWWSGLAHHLRMSGMAGVPDQLTRGGDLVTNWLAPDLLLSQTCGYPLTHALSGHVQIVATPCYDAPGCHGAWYTSVILIHRKNTAQSLADLAGCIAVINGLDSQSGCHALRHSVAGIAGQSPFFSTICISGSHVASIEAITHGKADVAAVDAVTYALLVRHAAQQLADVRVLTCSRQAPGLPYITRRDMTPEAVACLRTGLSAALADPALAWARQALLLGGFEVLSHEDYAVIPAMENEVSRMGWPTWDH